MNTNNTATRTTRVKTQDGVQWGSFNDALVEDLDHINRVAEEEIIEQAKASAAFRYDLNKFASRMIDSEVAGLQTSLQSQAARLKAEALRNCQDRFQQLAGLGNRDATGGSPGLDSIRSQIELMKVQEIEHRARRRNLEGLLDKYEEIMDVETRPQASPPRGLGGEVDDDCNMSGDESSPNPPRWDRFRRDRHRYSEFE